MAVVHETISADARIKSDPEPFVGVTEMADSSVNFTIRVWVDNADLWPVKFDLTKAIKQCIRCQWRRHSVSDTNGAAYRHELESKDQIKQEGHILRLVRRQSLLKCLQYADQLCWDDAHANLGEE